MVDDGRAVYSYYSFINAVFERSFAVTFFLIIKISYVYYEVKHHESYNTIITKLGKQSFYVNIISLSLYIYT